MTLIIERQKCGTYTRHVRSHSEGKNFGLVFIASVYDREVKNGSGPSMLSFTKLFVNFGCEEILYIRSYLASSDEFAYQS